MCVSDIRTQCRTEALRRLGRVLLSSAGQCTGVPVSTPKNQSTQGDYAESGNKIPTIVQKFYTRLGKNLHEIANKFFWGSLGTGQEASASEFGTKRASPVVPLV